MRLACAAAVFLIFTLMGFAKSSELKLRWQLLEELKRLVTEFSVQIRCTAPTLDELADSCCGVFGELLRQERQSSPDIRTAWSRAAKRLSGCSFCGGEEGELLCELGRELGTCSAEGQLSLLELHAARLARLSGEALQALTARGKMFCTVGALLGAGAAILII